MNMVDVSNASHHLSVEAIAQVLCNKTRKEDPSFFRILATYYMAVMAASMRAKIRTKDRGEIPINNYVMALAESGFGKGVSTFTFEQDLMADFRSVFKEYIMPNRAEQNMRKLASRRAAISGLEEDKEFEQLEKELESCGEYPFVFDGASEPAIKQIRQMLLLADCGSINYQVDEVGSNLEKSGEALNTYLELYDQGMIKAKLTKNNSDNKRTKELEGKTPANMLLFGTPVRLMDSGQTEKRFVSMLETGYARRCLFALGDPSTAMDLDATAEEIYQRRINPQNFQAIQDWRQHFAYLADPSKLNWTIDVPDDVGIELLAYQQQCEKKARELGEFAEIERTELTHRYFKALKIAGTYAFIEETLEITMPQLHAAIKLVEESGAAFKKILTREPPYAKLARFLAHVGKEVTHAELMDALPFFKSAASRDRGDMLTLATAWGYGQHIVIRKNFVDGIEFFGGETLKETSLEEVELSYSTDFAHGYEHGYLPFDALHQLTQEKDHHWANHAFDQGHRLEDNVIPGFNLLVLDIDGTATLPQVHELLKDYVFMTYTTKRHTPETNRFRLVLPMNYQLKLDRDDYKEFMANVVEWLPFEVDESANQRSRKWASCEKGTYHYNLEGQMLDVLPFVPRTQKNELHKKGIQELGSLDNLERWFAKEFADGNRNNLMIKFALALVDSGMNYQQIEDRVIAFNNKLSNGLAVAELRSTVLQTVAQRLQGAP